MPYACTLPIAQPPPAGHAAAKAQLLGKVLPRCAAMQLEQDAIQGLLVAQPVSASLRRANGYRQQRLNPFVQRRANFFVFVFSHAASNALRAFDDDRLLLTALSTLLRSVCLLTDPTNDIASAAAPRLLGQSPPI